MARGQAAAASNNLATTNAIGAQQGAQASSLENNTLIPSYTNMLKTGYNTPQQAEAATNTGMGAVNTSFDTSQNLLNNQAARTNNPASLTAGSDQLALERGVAAGNEANNLSEQQFTNQQQAASGLGNLFNTNQQSSNQMYGLGPSTLQARAAGQPDPALGLVTSGIGALGQVFSGKG